jgi:leucyl aminopeptidase
MKFTIKTGDFKKLRKTTLVIGVSEEGTLTPTAERLDKQSHGFISKLIKQKDIQGKTGQTFLLPHIPGIPDYPILIVGCGKTLAVTERDFRRIVAASTRALNVSSATHATFFLLELNLDNRDTAWKVKHVVEASSDASYRFEHYKSKKTPASALKEISLHLTEKSALAQCENALQQGIAVSEAVSFTKNLANQPGNICTPTYLALQAKKLANAYRSLSIKILEEKDLKKLGMGAFLSVTKGSREAAKLVCLEYKGHTRNEAPVALVGKGITFDTGGISLKPAESMVGMKYDMCGAASVLGAIKAAADLKLPLHIVGILAIAENMPDGSASKPEDIVTTLSGQTVEILNTDAEGRLVLCDALTYCERFKPAVVIDIATLTGAVVVALGHHASGLLANNDALATDLLAAGNESHDRAWQLPLWEEYQDQLRSPFADMSNTGGRYAGSITAACFLSRFTKKFTWAHLDVAGTAAMMGGIDRYATGRPVPLLIQYLINYSTVNKAVKKRR